VAIGKLFNRHESNIRKREKSHCDRMQTDKKYKASYNAFTEAMA